MQNDKSAESPAKLPECACVPVALYATKTEVAKAFQVTTRTLESWMKRGLIAYVKIGRTVRFRMRDIDAQLLTINARN